MHDQKRLDDEASNLTLTGRDTSDDRETGHDRDVADDSDVAEDRLSTDDLVNSSQPEPQAEAQTETQSPPGPNEDDAPLELFGEDEVESFRDEWRDIQARFVDDPRDAVQGADHLVAEVMSSLATTFNNHKHDLEHQWQEGSDVQTEDLRQALRRYRTFFNQLLNA